MHDEGEGAHEGEGPLEPVAVRYLTTVLNQAQQSMTLRNSRELRTLAEALDRLIAGKTAEASAALAEMHRAFGDRFYVELQRHGLPKQAAAEPGRVPPGQG